MIKGIVIKSTGSWYAVRTLDNEVLDARLEGKFRLNNIRSTNPVVVGDRVDLIEGKDGYTISNIEPRTNYIVRKSINLSKRSHIIAANVDQAILVVTLSNPKTYTGFIDRFLVTAEAYHIPVTIIFNKVDLYEGKELEELDFLKMAYEKIGYTCLTTSAVNGTNLEVLSDSLKDKVTLVSGQSGVGKSTLLNAIEPTLDLKTGAISATHRSGKHTTTFSEMFPLSFGGYIIDTPGIKAFGLIDFDKNDLSHYFLEMRELLSGCQFNNCVHINEPHCAIKEALENGDIAPFRYQNYLSMYQEDETENYRTSKY